MAHSGWVVWCSLARFSLCSGYCWTRVSAYVCGRISTWDPESEFVGDRLAQYRRLESSPGPQDRWQVMEDGSATLGQILLAKFRDRVLEDSVMFDNWFGGAQLLSSEDPQTAVLPDYPSAQDDRERAGKDLDRSAPPGKVEVRTPRISVSARHI